MNHPMYAGLLVNRGDIQEALGRKNDAERSLRTAVSIQAGTLGSSSPAVAETMLKHARILSKLGRKGDAKQMERAARSILSQERAQGMAVSFAQLEKQASR